jgi:DNA anti-recombination protein RmuC
MTLRFALVCIGLIGALALAACGSEQESEEAAEGQATPAQARAEIGAVRRALDEAVAALRDGDARAAENAVAEGYLEHFEKVEGPLDEVDHALKERLEDGIREDLRGRIHDGASVAEVRRMVGAIKADLSVAERRLR